MFRVGFGQSYLKALRDGGGGVGRGGGGGGGVGGGGGGVGGGRGERGDQDEETEAQRRDRIQKSEEKTKLFRQRLKMESNRRNMAGKKNIVAFTKVEGGDHFQCSEVCKLLNDIGVNPSEVDGVMINCYRPNQIE